MRYILYYTKRMYTFSGNKLIINVLGMVLISLLEGTAILLLLPMISMSGIANMNAGVSPVSGIFKFLQEFPQSIGLPLILCMYVLLIIGQNLLQRSLTIRDTVIQQRFLRQLRLETYNALLQSNWNFFVRHRKSDLINLMGSELTRVGFGTNLVLQLVASLIFTLIQLGIAFWLSPSLTVFVLLFGLAIAFFQASSLEDHFRWEVKPPGYPKAF